MSDKEKKILVVDAFPLEIRNAFEEAFGEHGYGAVIRHLIASIVPHGLICDEAFALDQSPGQFKLEEYDGFVWSGSPLSVLDDCDDVRMTEAWMTACFSTGKPIFGICYGLQLAAKLAGGRVERNPKGREFIVARKISLTSAGENHRMMERRNSTFDGIAEHADHVAELPEGAVRLAGNDFSHIQAAAFDVDGCPVWGVQYHPDMDVRIILLLLRNRREELSAEGFFSSESDYDSYVARFERLQSEPDARDAAWQLGIDEDILDPAIRLAELECWIDHMIMGRG